MFFDNITEAQVKGSKMLFMNNLTKLTNRLTCLQEINKVVAVQNFWKIISNGQ